MPKPTKGESKQKYLRRCTKELIEGEGKKPAQAYAICNSYWEEEHGLELAPTRPMLRLASEEPISVQENGRFLMTAYTGKPVERWFGKLVIDIAGMNYKNAMPALQQHDPTRIVGAIEKAWKENNRLYAEGFFSNVTKAGKDVKGLADEGFPWQASIGVHGLQVLTLKDKDQKCDVNGIECEGPMEVWTKSEVYETSFVPMGADDATSAISFERGVDEPEYAVEYVSLDEPNKEKEVSGMLDLATISDALKTAKLTDQPAIEAFLLSRGVKDATQEAVLTALVLLERFKCEEFNGLFTALSVAFPVVPYATSPNTEAMDALQAELVLRKEEITGLEMKVQTLENVSKKKEEDARLEALGAEFDALCLPGTDKVALRARIVALPSEDAAALMQGLAEVDKAARASNLFKEEGSAGEPPPADVGTLASLERHMAPKLAAGKTYADAWREVLSEHAEEYIQYADSITARSA